MNIPYVFKKCTKCGEWLVASSVNFNKLKRGKYGLQAYCKKCQAEYYKEHGNEYIEIPNATKKCTKCGEILPATTEYFNKQKGGKYGLGAQCKKCQAEYGKEYREQNKEAIVEYQRQHYQENKEAIAERIKKYNQLPQGQVVLFNKTSRRRAKEQAQGQGITKEQWKELMSFFGWQCAYSGEVLTKETRSLDHIVPLNKGGANEIWNVVPMYKNYNLSKQDKDLLVWYSKQPYFSQERLNKIYEWQEYAYSKYGIIGNEAQ